VTRTVPAAYIRSTLGRRDPVLDRILRTSLLERRMPTIQVDDNAGRVLQLLAALRRPRQVIEIGTLFGYSAIHLARGLTGDGRLTTLEVDPDAAALARDNLAEAGLADRVEVVVGDAVDYLSSVPPASVGMIFIDGDKRSYLEYLTRCVPLLEDRGLLVADDAYAGGDYSTESIDGSGGVTEQDGIRAYAAAVGADERLLSAFVGTETGLLVSYRRPR
jgi:caffeoyl-CoA O-methyltransferase